MKELELTVLMPCLNEAETLESCIRKAQGAMEKLQISGEVLIADNGSTDGSREIASRLGARVVPVSERGYGAALLGGISAAYGTCCIMGDADDSYDFSNLAPFVEKLREGYDLVMGNRFQGGIEKGAMPFLHRYLGTPVISFLGRLFYKNKIGDFNCGMRGFRTERMRQLGLRTTGMEFASEMIVQAALHGYSIAEVPCTLSVDGRSRKPYLSTWSDGWRHLKFLLMHSPDWLFLYPGICLGLIGLVLMVRLLLGPIQLQDLSFDINTMLFASAFLLIGMNLVSFSCITKVYAANSGYIPLTPSMKRLQQLPTDKGVFAGVLLFLAGLVLSVAAVIFWGGTGFGDLDPRNMMRLTILAVALCILGVQMAFGSFLISILNIRHN